MKSFGTCRRSVSSATVFPTYWRTRWNRPRWFQLVRLENVKSPRKIKLKLLHLLFLTSPSFSVAIVLKPQGCFVVVMLKPHETSSHGDYENFSWMITCIPYGLKTWFHTCKILSGIKKDEEDMSFPSPLFVHQVLQITCLIFALIYVLGLSIYPEESCKLGLNTTTGLC